MASASVDGGDFFAVRAAPHGGRPIARILRRTYRAGTELAEQDCDVKGTIRCPYHRWCYTLDGSLVRTPLFDEVGVGHQRIEPDRQRAAGGRIEDRPRLRRPPFRWRQMALR